MVTITFNWAWVIIIIIILIGAVLCYQLSQRKRTDDTIGLAFSQVFGICLLILCLLIAAVIGGIFIW